MFRDWPEKYMMQYTCMQPALTLERMIWYRDRGRAADLTEVCRLVWSFFMSMAGIYPFRI